MREPHITVIKGQRGYWAYVRFDNHRYNADLVGHSYDEVHKKISGYLYRMESR